MEIKPAYSKQIKQSHIFINITEVGKRNKLFPVLFMRHV